MVIFPIYVCRTDKSDYLCIERRLPLVSAVTRIGVLFDWIFTFRSFVSPLIIHSITPTQCHVSGKKRE